MKEDDKMQGIHRRLVKQYHEETKDDAHPPEHGIQEWLADRVAKLEKGIDREIEALDYWNSTLSKQFGVACYDGVRTRLMGLKYIPKKPNLKVIMDKMKSYKCNTCNDSKWVVTHTIGYDDIKGRCPNCE